MQSTPNYDPNPVEKMQMTIETQVRLIQKLRVDLPRRGITGLLNNNNLTKASRELNRLEKDIEALSGNLSTNLNSATHKDMEEMINTMNSISVRIDTFVENRSKAINKTKSILSKIFPSQSKKEIAAARKEAEILTTYLNTYKEIFADPSLPENNVFYFEPKFKEAFDNPAFTEFAHQLAEILIFYPVRLTKPFDEGKNLWQKFESIVKEMNLPGDAGQLLIPFIRLLILKMDNPTLLSKNTLDKLNAVIENCQQQSLESEDEKQIEFLDRSRAACQYLAWGLEQVKLDLVEYLANKPSL